MDPTARHSAVFAGVGLAIGLALAFAIGWWLWPLEYTNATPDALRPDYADDYVLMTAAAYGVDGDLALARARLELLDPAAPAAPAVALAERLIESNGDVEEVIRLAHLAQALGTTPHSLQPFLGATP